MTVNIKSDLVVAFRQCYLSGKEIVAAMTQPRSIHFSVFNPDDFDIHRAWGKTGETLFIEQVKPLIYVCWFYFHEWSIGSRGGRRGRLEHRWYQKPALNRGQRF
jgi:hypothetical protein